jgi:hypothetical protein
MTDMSMIKYFVETWHATSQIISIQIISIQIIPMF